MNRESRYIRSCSSSPVYMKTQRGPRVSYEQVEALVDYMEYNRELACGYLNTTAGRYKATQKWHTVANSLNGMGSGAKKDGKGWSAYWSNFKNKLKGRVRKLRAMANGERIQTTSLSDIDKRALAILGPRYEISQFSVQVEVDPFLEDETNDGGYIPDSPPSRDGSPEQAEPELAEPERAELEPAVSVRADTERAVSERAETECAVSERAVPERAVPMRAASTPMHANEPRPESPRNLTIDRKRRYIPEPSSPPPPASAGGSPGADTARALSRVAAALEALAGAQAQHSAALQASALALRAATAALEAVAGALQRDQRQTPRGPSDQRTPIKKEDS